MTSAEAARRREALEWVRRMHDPDFRDWEEHVAWLERSPDNARALDDALLQVETVTSGLAPADELPTAVERPAANDDRPSPASGRRWLPSALIGGAIAASVFGAVTFWSNAGGDRRHMVRTAPGETRTLGLPDGSIVALNGDTVVGLDDADSRRVDVERGEALFMVAHRADRPFTVRSGDAVVTDVGTVFDVARAGDRIDVGVREGAVAFARAGASVRLAAGDVLRADGPAAAVVRHVQPASVGGWQTGRLTYTQAPMTDLANDLSRSTGRPVFVAPDVGGRRFSGVITLGGNRDALARRVEAVTGLSMRRDGTGWRIASPGR